jgi:predicted transcriptional regulator
VKEMFSEKDKKIIELLKKDKKGLTIIELARLTNFSTHTTAICLAKLEGAEKIEIRKAGSAKIHYWK